MRKAEKVKNYSAHIRAQVLAGMANNASGAWFKPGGGVAEGTDSPVIKNSYYGVCGKKGAR
jgi:hypothetical protein